MWPSLPTTLLALAMLSIPASAHPQRRSNSSSACTSSTSALPEKNHTSIPKPPTVIYTTYTVIPIPATILTTFSEVPMPNEAPPATFLTSFSAVPERALVTPASYTETFTPVPMPTASAANMSHTFIASPFPSNLGAAPTLPGPQETPSASLFSSFSMATATPTTLPDGMSYTGHRNRIVNCTGTGSRASYPHASGSAGSRFPLKRPAISGSTSSRPHFTLKDRAAIPTPPSDGDGYTGPLTPGTGYITFNAKPYSEAYAEYTSCKSHNPRPSEC